MSVHDELRKMTLPRVPGKQETLRNRVLEYRTGDITQQQFLAYLDEQHRRGTRIIEEFSDERIDAETLVFMKDMLDYGRRGIYAQLQALETMRQWCHTPHKSLMDAAMAFAGQGDSLLNDALQLGWDLSLTMDEAAIELLKALGVDPERGGS